jgi:signal transduction histidine kinase/ActR/RegA family two-component response regulator
VNRLTERIVLGGCLLATLVLAVFAAARAGNGAGEAAALIGALIAIVASGVSLVRSISRPMHTLAAVARRYGRGDFSARVPERGIEELRGLAAALNEMAVATGVARAQLNEQAARLAVSRDEAESAGRAKTEFLSRMSHELRTPLNAILGFAQLLELDELDARQRENVGHIVSGGRHLLDLINEVLEITRLDVGGATPTIESVHVPTLAREAVELVTPLAAKRKIEMRVNVNRPEDDVWVAADQQRLKQILLNLLANAVKYNRDEGSVTVTVKRIDGKVRLRVTDTGQGIAQDQLPKLFTPFERLGAESTGVEGTGLGLTLALRLAEAMGGTMGVESQPWIGSTFHVELPLVDAPVAESDDALLNISDSGPRPRLEGDLSVLYIEDDVANVKLISKLFAGEPRIKLMTTLHGKLGIELARVHQPDLILLDLHLPDITGEEVIKRLRIDERTSATPVVIVSADALEDTKARFRLLGAKGYLTKPLELDKVMATVRGVLEQRQLEAV